MRASTGKQDLDHQKLELLDFARQNSLTIDEFVEIKISSRMTGKQRRIDELLEKLAQADTLMVTELSRLGRSTAEVISLVNSLIKQNIRLIALKQKMDISQHDMKSKIMVTLFSLFSELEETSLAYERKRLLPPKRNKDKFWASLREQSKKVSLIRILKK